MRLSEEKLNRNIKKQILGILYQAIADLKNPKEVKVFLKDFLSETEGIALAKRLAVVIFLDKKRPYENIKQTLKISSATIASFYKRFPNEGVQLVLQKVKAEQWADKWAKRVDGVWKKMTNVIPGLTRDL